MTGEGVTGEGGGGAGPGGADPGGLPPHDLPGGVVERRRWDGTTYTATHWRGRVQVGRLVLVVTPQVRLHVEAGGWLLRGGCAGPEVLWRRGTAEDGGPEREAVADGFTGASPAYALALLPRLGEVPRRLRLVEVTDPVLATRLVDQEWSRVGTLLMVTDLATGARRTLTPP